MRNYLSSLAFIALLLLATACNTASKQTEADKLLYNATFYTLNDSLPTAEAVVIKDGKILAVGSKDSLLALYKVKEQVNLDRTFVYPGFIDGHGHFYGVGMFSHRADLTGSKSFEEMMERVKAFAKTNNEPWLLGRGWDQNIWASKEFPDKTELDKLFPDKPVLLKRVDGHAALVNQKALDLAGITGKTVIAGGKIVLKNGKPTGVLVDNAVDSVEKYIPEPANEQIRAYLLKAQQICFENGLTTMVDPGLDRKYIEQIQKLQEAGELKIRLFVMANADDANMDYYIKKGPIKTPLLHVNAFKLYGDGALGSRGACLLHPYHDEPSAAGFLLSSPERITEIVNRVAKSNFQLCAHSIGDSANRYLLDSYAKALGENNNRRWRIEHAQVMHPDDIAKYGQYTILPSMQPTHATSDMDWADERLGNERLKYAYALKTLMQQNGLVILGTDAPVENVNPLGTFYAAVARKDAGGNPPNGFQKTNALSRSETLKGMTIWAAYGSFEEKEKGSIEPGKYADFTILNTDLFSCKEEDILKTKVLSTWVDGKMVYGK